MYFVFSKLLIFILNPLNWIFSLFIIAAFVKNKKTKRRLVISSIVVLYLCSVPFFLDQFAIRWDYHGFKGQRPKPYSCAIILGGFASEAGKNNRGYFNSASDRFIQALKLKASGQVSHILITSGNADLSPDSFREADWVKGELQAVNVPDSSVLIEDQSRNTIENAAFSKVLLQKQHLQPPYVLVTSAFHMRRSMFIFKKTGLDVVPYSCNYIAGSYRFNLIDFIPNVEVMPVWCKYLKEIVGLITAYIKL